MQYELINCGPEGVTRTSMGYFHWTEAMSVGVEPLDADHRCLVRIINLLHSLQDEDDTGRTVARVLDTLKTYGRVHFKREERVMDVARFPGNAFHRAEHQGFLRYMEFLRSRYSGSSDPRAGRELFDYLTGWLRHHILIQDMAYKPYVNNVANLESIAEDAAPSLADRLRLGGENAGGLSPAAP